MTYAIRTVTAASAIPLPFTLAEAKVHLRVDDTAEDALITAQIRGAMRHIENVTGHILTPRVLELAASAFPHKSDAMTIPREPITGIVSLTYTDEAGAAVVMDAASYRWAATASEIVLPAFGTDWPKSAAETGSVRVRFNAGYAAGEIEPDLIAATKLVLGHLFLNREAVVTGVTVAELPRAVADLCDCYRRLVV